MTFKLAAPPTNGIDLVQRGLQSFAASRSGSPVRGPRSGAPLRATAKALGTGELAAAAPHPVYDVPAESIRTGHGFDEARIVAWRYLLTRGSKVVGAAEVSGGTKRTAKAFAGVNHGPFAQATASLVAQIEDDPDFASGDHELRVVRIPPFYVMALWLHADKGDDWVLPLPPAPSYLEAGKRYSVKEFCALLADHAPDLAGQAPVEAAPKKASSRRKATPKTSRRTRRV